MYKLIPCVYNRLFLAVSNKTLKTARLRLFNEMERKIRNLSKLRDKLVEQINEIDKQIIVIQKEFLDTHKEK